MNYVHQLNRQRFFALAAFVALIFLPVRAQSPGQAAASPQAPWMNKNLSPDQRADLVIAQMTLDEKISLVHGAAPNPGTHPPENPATRSNGGAGFIPGIPRLGIPDLNMADSAVGVTLGARRSRYSTPLPSTLAEASSWDPQLAYEYGALIGRELRDQGYNMSLGGGVDITREPRNGRNFEYQGEDPVLAGTMVGQFIKGLQAQNVVGDIKHYALNDEETGRTVLSAHLDKRAMRETDLLAFEIGVETSGVGAVMCAYNRINSVYACENSYILNDVLKQNWGFKGFVVSDWGATHSTVKAALAGLDIEMPDSIYFGDALKEAVGSGDIPIARLDGMLHRILRTEFAMGIIDNPPVEKVVDVFGGLEAAQHVAEEGIVLLKNAGGQLPLRASAIKSIAVIGAHADVAVLSGGGSAQVDPPGGNAVPPPSGGRGRHPVYYPSSPFEAIRAKAPRAKVEYDAGIDWEAAAALAKASEVAIVFVNQPMSEGRDAATLSLPDDQDKLVDAVAAANPQTIVVLETGGPVSMPWVDHVSGVLESWYPGIRGGEAIANILFGDVNPSAKLPVTFAKSDADLPHPEVPGMNYLKQLPAAQAGERRPRIPPFDVDYTEGLKVGYKWFDAENKQPLFPFGFGLSYTTFAYSELKASRESVNFTVRNTGARGGVEIAEVYVGLPASANEPPKRLVAWQRIVLGSGESKSVILPLDPKYLCIFNVDRDRWELLPGEYKIFVGGSSQRTPLGANIRIDADQFIQ